MFNQAVSKKDSPAALGLMPNPRSPWRVAAVEVISSATLRIRFLDGAEGTVTFESSFFSGVFEKLNDPDYFRRAGIEYGAVTWPDGPDLAPDAMYEAIKAHGTWILR